jgi:diguanylate cyclase (GGDEF)-like protein/PAS domain S-box-containing protein
MYAGVVESGEPLVLDDYPYAPETAASAPGWFDNRGVLVGGQLSFTWRDVSERHRAAAALAASEGLFRTAMESAAIGMVINELDGEFRMVNRALCTMLKRDADWLIGRVFADVIVPDDLPLVAQARREMLDGETPSTITDVRLLTSEGATLWARAAVVLIHDSDGRPDYFLVQLEDVTAERQAQQELAFQAFHDPLTGLRNRAWILDMLEVDLRTAKRAGRSVGVLFIDLDHFKVVNDSLGHPAGDEVLATVADRIAAGLRPTDRVGRFGGDEFVVVVPDAREAHEVEKVAARIVDAVGDELDIQGHRVVPSVSIGIAMSTPTSTPADLLRDTDSALFRAKAAGRSRWQFFDQEMHAHAVARLTIEDQLRRAVDDRRFVVHYQPIVRLATGEVVGHEALVRWQHPDRGLLPPAEFLSVAEESGLIVPIGEQVLEAVCERLVSGPALVGPLSVNISPVQMARANWHEGVVAIIRRYGVEPSRLTIEVTETAVMSSLDTTYRDLVALRGLGMGLHVDDFGTGFSSISLLRDLPVTGLKLDARFVHDLDEGPSHANALAAGVAGLVTSMGLEGIAEGIETEQQARIVREQGWDCGQGFYFGRPAP